MISAPGHNMTRNLFKPCHNANQNKGKCFYASQKKLSVSIHAVNLTLIHFPMLVVLIAQYRMINTKPPQDNSATYEI